MAKKAGSGDKSGLVQVIVAVIGAGALVLVGWWQYGSKPSTPDWQTRPTETTKPVVNIRTVSYGYAPSEWCNADKVTATIGKRCDGLSECSPFKVDNDLCPDGDPAPQKRKTMRVTYDCSGEGRPTVSGQDGDMITLSCK